MRDSVHRLVRRGRSFPRTDGTRAGAGPNLADYAGGHRGFGDVVTAVVVAADPVKGDRRQLVLPAL